MVRPSSRETRSSRGSKRAASRRVQSVRHRAREDSVLSPRPSPVPYEGERGTGRCSKGCRTARLGAEIKDDDELIGLYDAHSGGAISLEPGGQFELSGAPVATRT